MLKRLVLGIVLVCLSHSAFAVTSVCSAEASSSFGLSALKHEATWSLHDNWFFNLHVKVRSQVNGPVAPMRQDVQEMNSGGQQVHFLDAPIDGDYTVRGQVEIGYPLGWGFDGYYVIECEPWSGYLVNSIDSDDGHDDPFHSDTGENLLVATAQSSGVDEYIDAVCASPSEKMHCEQLTSLSEKARQVLADKLKDLMRPTRSATGFIAAVDEQTISLRSTSGHYTRFALTSNFTVTRHTESLITAVQAQDRVHVQRLPDDQHVSGVLVLRGYAGDLPRYQGLKQDESVEQFPASRVVTMIDVAEFSQLKPITSYVRIVARQADSGRLEVQAIEILRDF